MRLMVWGPPGEVDALRHRSVLKPGALVPGQTFFESLKSYVGFTESSSAALRALHPAAAPQFERIIDDFYATITAHPGASAAITGGQAQIDRLKQTLVAWLDMLLLGPHDEAYFEKRARIGRMHVRIELPQSYMFTAMNRIRVQLADVIHRALERDPDALKRSTEALHQIMDLELAIMLETYREDLLAKNRTAERLATIGQFAAGIGHELRNPLGVMESSIFLLKQHCEQLGIQDQRIHRHLDKIAAEVKRSNKTINDLLELARNRPPQRQKVDVAQLVTGAIDGAPVPPDISVEVHVPPALTIDGDGGQLSQVLQNLVQNASQALGGKGHIHIDGERRNGETRIRVRDDGPGIPPDIRHRIFEALFTTKAKGSGLGLALCRRIVEAHGGSIVLEPSDGGASFLVAIPDLPSGTEAKPI